MKTKSIKIEDYFYNLPDEKIAKYPLAKRDDSKLLVYKNGEINHQNFSGIENFFSENDLLVFNDTKVIQARMIFRKTTGARIEIFCLEPYSPADYEQIFQTNSECSWKCIVGNSKKWKNDFLTTNITINNKELELKAEKIEKEENSHIIKFSWDNTDISFSEILEQFGTIPIPPYLNRKSEESDLTRYQTVYSEYKGSVAAPTAGLHFTDDILQKISNKNTKIEKVTLHVGAGTFKPVKSEEIGEHEMHSEHFIISEKTLKNIIERIGSITAVGTTSVRTLESLYWLGVKIISGIENPENKILQWEVYDLNSEISVKKSLKALLGYVSSQENKQLSAQTQIIIAPGYEFKIVNRIITNFHQPKSTLLLLISAFIGEDWQNIYDYALKNNFRFLSYGDSSILQA